MPARLTAEDFHAVATQRGMKWLGQGVPLSNEVTLWLCPAGHEWRSHYNNVRSGKNCPTCLHERLGRERRLKDSDYQELALARRLEWLGPLPRSNDRGTTWRCRKAQHQFEMPYTTMSGKAVGCPYCSGRRVGDTNSLKILRPEVAAEWHPTLNGDLTPDRVTVSSNRKVWWQCRRGHPPWQTSVDKRTRPIDPTGCPDCSPIGTSRLELRVYSEFLTIFDDVRWRHKVAGRECDVYLPVIATGIEVDGRAWHSGKAKEVADKKKSKHFADHGVDLYRVRELPLRPLSARDVSSEAGGPQLPVIKSLLQSILQHRNPPEPYRSRIEKYLAVGEFQNADDYEMKLAALPGPPIEQSFASVYPDIARDWLQERNGPITPQMVWPSSHQEYWWQCPDVPYHQYKRGLSLRTGQKQGCPFCVSRKDVHPLDSLEARFPEIAREWHPTKNGDIKPSQVMPRSGKPVWWQCAVGHEWRTTPDKRVDRRSACPKCRAARN